MFSRRSVARLSAALLVMLPLATQSQAQMFPITATGWNQDIVVESTAVAPYSAAAAPFDVGNNLAWYERSLPGSTKGLPVGGSFVSVTDGSIAAQMQPYSGPNALVLNAGAPTGTLTFAPASQIRYDQIAVFASSASGGGTGTLVVTFTDASSSAPINFNAQDWFNVTTNNGLNNLGRANLNTNVVDDASTGNPRVYQTIINLTTLLGVNNRQIASITFTKPATGAATAIFAVSGQRAIDSLTPVVATGWNRDIVVEAGAFAPFDTYAMSFDTFNNIAWYESGLPGGTKGLPAGGTFSSLSNAAIQGAMQPYDAPNALFLDVNAPTASLTFSPVAQRSYDFLCVFAASSNQGGTGTLVITFTDTTTSAPIAFNAQDWFNVTTNNALNNLGRLGLGGLTTDDGSAGNPRIYQTVIDLAARGLSNRAVQSIAFTKPAIVGNAQNTAIMAISGQPTSGATGACTFPDGTCALLPQVNCTGTFQGNGSTCPPTGACIAANGDCTLRYQANCSFVAGSYQGNNTTCPAPGGCIAANGNCTLLNSFQCAVQSGTFLGAATPCPGTGACCSTGSCTILNSFQCTFAGGSFQGVGTVCNLSYASIEVAGGAFEDISGTGSEVTWTTGTNDDGYAQIGIGFTFPFFGATFTDAFVGTNGLITFGAGSTAFTNACPVPGAAAPNNGIYPSWDDLHIGGILAHPGRVYTQMLTSPNRFIVQWNRVGQYNAGQEPTDENTFEAVLFENGNIEFRYGTITAQVACDATVGIEDGAGTAGLNFDNTALGTGNTSLRMVAVQPCPTVSDGACCCGSHCSITAAAACTGAGRTFAGGGTVCTPFSNTTPCCRGDYNKSGVPASVQDIFDFLTGYFSTDTCADTNDSGTVSVQDIFDFLTAYFGGC